MDKRLGIINAALQGNGFGPMSVEAFAKADSIPWAPWATQRGGDYAAERVVKAAPRDFTVQERAISIALLRQAKKHAALHIEALNGYALGRSPELEEALRYAKMSLMYLNVHLQDNE